MHIVFQWYAGDNVDMGKDFTIFSKVEGIVIFDKKKEKAAVSYPVYLVQLSYHKQGIISA